MTTSEAIKHLFKTLSAYKERCNSEWCDKDKEALGVLTKELEKREKGLIIELPVPIGGDVFGIASDLRGVIKTGLSYEYIAEIKEFWNIYFFATEEEAEEKLKELKEKK